MHIGAYKRFPPKVGKVFLPLTGRDDALSTLTLLSPVKRLAVWGTAVARWIVAASGPGALPGRRLDIESPVDEAAWRRLCAEWEAAWGPWTAIGFYSRPEASRPGYAMLLVKDGRPLAFVKIRRTDLASLENEVRALELLGGDPTVEFWVPRVLSTGGTDGWRFVAIEPLPAGLHRPHWTADLGAVTAEVRTRLTGLPKAPETPSHWQPMHGDFTPWNLRRTSSGRAILVDWEYAGWGPPRADEALFLATRALTTGELASDCDAVEAIEFWHGRISGWPRVQGRRGKYAASMLRILERMRDAALDGSERSPSGSR